MNENSRKQNVQIEKHIEKIVELPTLLQKRAYLETLSKDTFDQVVKTYFNIVENSLFEKSKELH